MSGAHHGGKGDKDRTNPAIYRKNFPLGSRCIDCTNYVRYCEDDHHITDKACEHFTMEEEDA